MNPYQSQLPQGTGFWVRLGESVLWILAFTNLAALAFLIGTSLAMIAVAIIQSF